MKDSRNSVSSRRLFGAVLAVAVFALACSADRAVFADKDGTEPAGSDVMAKVGEIEISRADLEEVLSADLERLDQEYKKNRYDLMEQGLENMIIEKLIEAEAASRDISVDDLFTVEIEDNLDEITDEQVDAFYESRKAQIPQPKEQVAEQPHGAR